MQKNKSNSNTKILQKSMNNKLNTFNFDTTSLPPVSIFKILFTFAFRYEIIIFLIGIIGAIGNGITMQFLEYETGKLINEITINPTIENIQKGINTICQRYVIIGIISFISCLLMKGMMLYFSKRIGNKYKIEFFNLLLKQNQSWFDNASMNTYELSNLVVLQVESIQNGIGMALGNVVLHLVTISTAIIISLYLNWKFALVCSCVIPVWIGLKVYVFKVAENSKNKQKDFLNKVGGQLEELLYKIKTVASFGNFDYEKEQYSNKLELSLQLGRFRSFKTGISMSVIGFMIFFSAAIDFWYGSHLLSIGEMSGDHLFNTGELYTITLLITHIGFSVVEMVTNLRSIAESRSDSKFIFSLRQYTHTNHISRLKQIKEVELNKREINKGEIKFDNVCFYYDKINKTPVLSNLSFTIPSGKTTALIGESGCGKTTIVNLIERIYEPTEGNITIDGISIDYINIDHYRNSIGYVAQEPVLFNDSIRENVIFGRKNVVEDQIINSLENANILKFVKGLNNGLDYIVGIKGGKLSGGQKQRIAIARALLNNPKVLILDEATSSLDIKSERQVQKSIDKLKGQMTMIIIAHRLNTIQTADNIIVLSKGGNIIEQGTHEDLLSVKGKYFELLKQRELEKRSTLKDNIIEENKSLINESDRSYTEISLHKLQKTEVTIEDKKDINNNNKENISAFKKRNLSKLNRVISNFKCLFFSGFNFSLLTGVLMPLSGMVFGMGINTISSTNIEHIKMEGSIFGLYFLLIGQVRLILDFIKTYSFELLGEHASVSFKKQILNTLLKLHIGYFDIKENTPGQLVSQMTIKTSLINSVVLDLFSIIIQSIGTAICTNIIGYIFDYRLTLIVFTFIPIIIIINYLYTKSISQANKDTLNQTYGSILSEALCNTTTIFAFNAQEKVKTIFARAVYKDKKEDKKYAVYHGMFYGFTMSLFFFAYALYIYSAGVFILNNTLSFSTLIKAMAALMNGTYVIGTAIKFISDVSLMHQAINSIYELIDTQSEIDPLIPNKLKPNKDTFKGKIEFKNVYFAYPAQLDKVVLNNISFTIRSGEIVGLIGKSGSGKSTITELIERFYDATQGEVLLDDINVKEYDLPSIRRMIGYVQQEPALFSKSVYDNIKYGNLNASDEEIINVAKECKIDFKLNINIENNTNDMLSGGEKQRVAIARALLHSPKILLLDEATSSLDNTTEREILQILRRISTEKKMTVIVIAHKPNTVEFCDKCFQIKNGVIVMNEN